MGAHCVIRRVPGTASTSIDGIHSHPAWSSTACNISSQSDSGSEHLPHRCVPMYPQTRYSNTYGLDPLAYVRGNRGLYPVRTAFLGSKAWTYISFWACASFQCHPCLDATPLPRLCLDGGSCSLLATSIW